MKITHRDLYKLLSDNDEDADSVERKFDREQFKQTQNKKIAKERHKDSLRNKENREQQ